MFAYELEIKNWSELWFFLFKPKKCPACRCRLYRVDVLPELSSGWEAENSSNGIDIEYEHKTKESIRYRCDPCHAYYSLTDLVSNA